MKVFKKVFKYSAILLSVTYLHSYKDEIFYPYIYKKTKIKLFLKNLVEDFRYYDQNLNDYMKINPKIKKDEIIFGEIKDMYKIAKDKFNKKSNEVKEEMSNKLSYQIVEIFPHNMLDLQKVIQLSEKYNFPIATSNERWFELNKKYFIKINLSKYLINDSSTIAVDDDFLKLNVDTQIKDIKTMIEFKFKNIDIDENTRIRDIINNPFYFDEDFVERIAGFDVVFPSDKIIAIDDNNISVYSKNFYNKFNFLYGFETYGIIPSIKLKLKEKNVKENRKHDLHNEEKSKIKILSNFSEKTISNEVFLSKREKNNKICEYMNQIIGLDLVNKENIPQFEEINFYRKLKINTKNSKEKDYILNRINLFIESAKSFDESMNECEKYSFFENTESDGNIKQGTSQTIDNKSSNITNSEYSSKKLFRNKIDKMKALKIFTHLKEKSMNNKNIDISNDSFNKVYYLAIEYDDILEIDFLNKNDYFYNENVDKVICKIDEISSNLNLSLTIDKPLINDRFHDINDSIKFGVNLMKINKEIKKILDPDNLINPHLSPIKPNFFQEIKQKNKLLNYIIDKLELI